jgi:integrase/recombinase XerD
MVRKLPKIITREEYEQLLVYCKTKKPKHWKQYNLCMMLGFEAGLRISEIVGYADRVPALTASNFNLQQNTIRINEGKGQKDRIVPCPKRITASQLTLLPIPIKRRAIQHFVTSLAKKVLNKAISFHTLRHGFGSHLAANNRPLHEIQMLMGHSNLQTTGIYLHANPKQAVEGARDVF